MKVIISESQYRQIIESENRGNLFIVPEEFIVDEYNEHSEYDFYKVNKLFEENKSKRGWDGIKVLTTLDLENYYIKSNEIKNFLNNLVEVDGSLYLSGKDITSLPKLVRVNGDFDISRSKIKTIPLLEYVSGDFNLYKSKLESLPDSLSIGGDLIIANTPLVKYLDEDIKEKINVQGEIIR